MVGTVPAEILRKVRFLLPVEQTFIPKGLMADDLRYFVEWTKTKIYPRLQ